MENHNSEIEVLEAQLRENPDSPVFARLASLYVESGEYLHALALCDRGTTIYPEYATGYLLRANALYRIGKYEEAAENYKKVLEILPRCTFALNRLVELQKRTVKEGRKHEGKADPDDSTEQGSIANIAERLKRYKPVRSQTDDVQEEPDEDDFTAENDKKEETLPIVSETLASIFFKQKQYEKAIEAYRQLIKRTPGKADIYHSKIKEVQEAKENDA